ncbi:MAG TPA: hypothetical protein VKG05_13265 [Steroidobacteraceae bacterium]|nr:hypothetical protein [Steroidobacteraceae bacterium]
MKFALTDSSRSSPLMIDICQIASKPFQTPGGLRKLHVANRLLAWKLRSSSDDFSKEGRHKWESSGVSRGHAPVQFTVRREWRLTGAHFRRLNVAWPKPAVASSEKAAKQISGDQAMSARSESAYRFKVRCSLRLHPARAAAVPRFEFFP